MSPDVRHAVETVHDPKVLEIVRWLESAGAVVEYGRREDYGIVSVEAQGQLQCVDGRAPSADQSEVKIGPKFPGALEGVAYFVAKAQQGVKMIAEEHVEAAVSLITKLGFKPGVHDMSAAHLHCGHAGLVSKGMFEIGMGINPDEIARISQDAGGVNPTLDGEHHESKVILNFASMTTRNPDDANQMFCVDLWFAKLLGLDPAEVAKHSAETVQKLRSEAWKRVVIIA